jgi:hypothetical protein
MVASCDCLNFAHRYNSPWLQHDLGHIKFKNNACFLDYFLLSASYFQCGLRTSLYSHLPTASNKTCVTDPKYVLQQQDPQLKHLFSISSTKTSLDCFFVSLIILSKVARARSFSRLHNRWSLSLKFGQIWPKRPFCLVQNGPKCFFCLVSPPFLPRFFVKERAEQTREREW